MTRITAWLLFLLLVAFSRPLPALAAGEFELGFDAGFTVSRIDDVDDDLVTAGFPAPGFGPLLQNLRVGYLVTPVFEVESSMGFSYLSQGGDSFWRLGWGLSGLIHPGSADRPPERAGLYFRAGAQVDVVGGDNESETQLGAGAGVGAKLGLGDRWALRPEAGVVRRFETDERPGSWDLSGSVGFSFFTEPPSGNGR